MITTETVNVFVDTYQILCINESGSKTFLETGIPKYVKPIYLNDHVYYLNECNPTKSFSILNNDRQFLHE